MERSVVRGRWLATLLLGAACAGGSQVRVVSTDDGGVTVDATSLADAADDGATGAMDAGAAIDVPPPGTCPTAAPAGDLCAEVPSGTLTACSHDAAGQPSQNGYLEVRGPDGTGRYLCAVAWLPGGSGGYQFDTMAEQFMSDPASCCGMPATPIAAPTAPPPAFGYLGALHGPRAVKPQESMQPDGGAIRQNPFAVVLQDASGGAALATALANWKAWAGDGHAHPAPDGSGAYYFSGQLLVNYTILETGDGRPIAVVGPEVSLTADGSAPLGHPTLGACAAGGGAPLVLMAGELFGTTLTNHSGRFGHDPSGTPEGLDHAAALFECFGVLVTKTMYYAPKP